MQYDKLLQTPTCSYTSLLPTSLPQVNNGKFATLVINLVHVVFCRRHQLQSLGATLLRRAWWMLQSGKPNYELEASLVCGRYGGAADRARLERGVRGRERESAGTCRRELRLLELILYGKNEQYVQLTAEDIVYRPRLHTTQTQIEIHRNAILGLCICCIVASRCNQAQLHLIALCI
jgi:hypothetical protein